MHGQQNIKTLFSVTVSWIWCGKIWYS